MALAIVVPQPESKLEVAQLATLTISKEAWLTNVADNIFQSIKQDHPKLVWTVKADDENLTWFFDKADGSLVRGNDVMFWYGIEPGEQLNQLMRDFTLHGRSMLGDSNLESRLHKAAQIASQNLRSHFASSSPNNQARGFSSLARRPLTGVIPTGFIPNPAARGYATVTTTTNPNPPASRQDGSAFDGTTRARVVSTTCMRIYLTNIDLHLSDTGQEIDGCRLTR